MYAQNNVKSYVFPKNYKANRTKTKRQNKQNKKPKPK